MRAVILKAFGGTENFEDGEWPEPSPTPSEVKIKAKAVSVNPQIIKHVWEETKVQFLLF